MLESLVVQNESRTLEFKENAKSLLPIIKTVIAFANTSGGNVIIGIRDTDKKIVGVDDPLLEEERLASVIADSIKPLIVPDIQISSFRNKELILIYVPHMVGPFYLKSAGLEQGTYIRLGSTNRVADSDMILSLQMLAKNISFDELPCMGATEKDLNHDVLNGSLSVVFGKLSKKHYESLGIVAKQQNKHYLTNGGTLLFAQDRFKWFPDTIIECVCFADKTTEKIVDRESITSPLIIAHNKVLDFIKKNTRVGAKIHASTREDIQQYPTVAIREALINAIVHTDYTITDSAIKVAIFSDRIEITNPGGLTYGQTIEMALSGISRMRNRMMGRIFREIKLIERLGTGLQRIIATYKKTKAKQPLIQELNTHFRVILYTADEHVKPQSLSSWEKLLLERLAGSDELGTDDIAKLWNVTTRTARTRLKKMVEEGLILRIATSKKDPYAVFKRK